MILFVAPQKFSRPIRWVCDTYTVRLLLCERLSDKSSAKNTVATIHESKILGPAQEKRLVFHILQKNDVFVVLEIAAPNRKW